MGVHFTSRDRETGEGRIHAAKHREVFKESLLYCALCTFQHDSVLKHEDNAGVALGHISDCP